MRKRLAQLQEQLDGLSFEHVTHVPLDAMLTDVLAPKSGALRTSRAANLPGSDSYHVRVSVKGHDVKLTPNSQMHSWQPILRARAQSRGSGSALVGTVTWSGPTRFFTVAFPILGMIFVAVGIGAGILKLVSGDITDALSGLGAVGFGIIFGGGSLAMSLWGASQARQDQAYLVDWLRLQLPDGDEAQGL
jgi:hypothetical protein